MFCSIFFPETFSHERFYPACFQYHPLLLAKPVAGQDFTRFQNCCGTFFQIKRDCHAIPDFAADAGADDGDKSKVYRITVEYPGKRV